MSQSTESDGPAKDVDFKETKAYKLIREFIYQIDHSIKTEKQIECSDPIIVKIKDLIYSTPLSNEHTRFANAAMKTVIERIHEISDDLYIKESFGNPIRMDFGTGHELNYLCYLFRRYKENQIKINEIASLVREYSRVVRFYINKFHIETAGARGCWSVDDYLLLPYLFGSAENFNRSEPIECIGTGMFREAWDNRQSQGLIDQICKLEWKNINIGLLKMYEDEVLGKRVVTQHFLYSNELPLEHD